LKSTSQHGAGGVHRRFWLKRHASASAHGGATLLDMSDALVVRRAQAAICADMGGFEGYSEAKASASASGDTSDHCPVPSV